MTGIWSGGTGKCGWWLKSEELKTRCCMSNQPPWIEFDRITACAIYPGRLRKYCEPVPPERWRRGAFPYRLRLLRLEWAQLRSPFENRGDERRSHPVPAARRIFPSSAYDTNLR